MIIWWMNNLHRGHSWPFIHGNETITSTYKRRGNTKRHASGSSKICCKLFRFKSQSIWNCWLFCPRILLFWSPWELNSYENRDFCMCLNKWSSVWSHVACHITDFYTRKYKSETFKGINNIMLILIDFTTKWRSLKSYSWQKRHS